MSAGCRGRPGRPTGCCRNRNRNIVVEPGPLQNMRSAIRSIKNKRSFPPIRRLWSAAFGPMPGVSTICTATCGNGAKTLGTKITRAIPHPTALPGKVANSLFAFCAAVAGATIHWTSARPPAAVSNPATATMTAVSGLPERFHLLLLNLFTSWAWQGDLGRSRAEFLQCVWVMVRSEAGSVYRIPTPKEHNE